MIARQAQKATLSSGALTSGRKSRRAALLASTALTSAILGGVMLAPQSAFAATACTWNAGPTPNTITCSGTGTGLNAFGVPIVAVVTNTAGVNTTINAAAVVTSVPPVGPANFAPISVTLSAAAPAFNFTMNNPSSITSTGTGTGADAVDVTGINPTGTVSGTWSIGGTIESTCRHGHRHYPSGRNRRVRDRDDGRLGAAS